MGVKMDLARSGVRAFRQAATKHELPTQEQLARAVFVEDNLDARPGGAKRMRRLDSDALDAALFAKRITIDEHTTLERLRGELYRAGLVFCPRAGAEVSGTTGQGQFLADTAFQRARRVSVQMTALAQELTSAELRVLVSVLTMDEVVDRAGGLILKRAVPVLDKIYDVKR